MEVFISGEFEVECPGCRDGGPFESDIYCFVCQNRETVKVWVESPVEVDLDFEDLRQDLD